MSIADAYTPGPALLANAGVRLTEFHPDQDTADFLLYRTCLESGTLGNPFSYYASDQSGLGLLRLKSGSLLFTSLPSGACASLTGKGIFLLDCSSTYRIIVHGAAEYDLLRFDGYSLSCFLRHLPGDTPLCQVAPAAFQPGEFLPLFEKKGIDPILCHMLLTELLSKLVLAHTVPTRTVPSYLAEIKAQLEEHYYDSYTLAGLALRYKVSKYRICREFRDCFQTSPLQYLHKVRVQAAKELLAETDLKIHEISYEVGYENVNHFISHFKKNTGMTPTEYRLSIATVQTGH